MSNQIQNTKEQEWIDIIDPVIDYVHAQFPKLRYYQVIEAIKKAGPVKQHVMEYLKNKYLVYYISMKMPVKVIIKGKANAGLAYPVLCLC